MRVLRAGGASCLSRGCPGYRQVRPLVYGECDVVVVCTEERLGLADWYKELPHIPLLSVLTKQDRPGPVTSQQAGLPTSALTGHNVEKMFAMCWDISCRTVRPASLQLCGVRPSRLYSTNKSHNVLPKLTPAPSPLSPTPHSARL